MSVVERGISAAELEGGYVRLSQAEAHSLGLPEFSGHVELSFAGEPASLSWDARARRLSGELITDAVALEASIGSLLRWTRDGASLVLEVASAPSTVHTPYGGGAFARPSWQAPAPPSRRAPSPPRPKRRRVLPTRTRNRVTADFEWTGDVGISVESQTALEKALKSGGWDDPESFLLRLRGEGLACLGGFDELLGVAASAVDPMDHQIAAVSKALSVMKGRAILADEVGLGKTIEAGLILKELELRGLASRVLIVTPATLREQWKAELAEKFGLEATAIASSRDGLEGQRLIMSLQLARNLRHELMRRQWDMVILDEAHRAAGPGARATRELLEGLDSRYRLFLTATPVNNDLLELYRLVSLLRPGTFASQSEFSRKFVRDGDTRSPRNAQDLRQLVSNVMIRTTREQAGLDNVRRHAIDVPVRLSAAEKASYALVVQLLREVLTSPSDRMRRDSLVRSLTLSPRGLYESAKQAASQHADARTRQVLDQLAAIAADSGPSSRQRTAIQIVRRWLEDPDKGRVLIFTQHTRVLSDLIRVLAEEGITAVPYHGGMAATAKRKSLEAFRSDVRVLVSTDAGAEGLNLQHANAVINYDLPWNPMRIEQRIGRVHRVTQTRDVHIANLFSEGTIDEHVYRILVDKLKMFEILFGQVTTILGELEDSSRHEVGGFEGQVKHALYAGTDREMVRRLESLARSTGEARERAEEQFQSQGGISAWLAPLSKHRDSLKKDGGQLRPKPVDAVGTRAEDARRFVLDWLMSRGVTVEHEARDFLSVRLPEELQAIFGSDRVHLAFSPDSLHLHPEAELCVLGSPVFEELLAASAEYGDLLGWTIDHARIDALPPALVPDHPEGWELKERRVARVPIAGGTSHWLVSDEDTRREPEILQVPWGEHTPDETAHVPHRTVGTGDVVRPLPLQIGTPRTFTRTVRADAVPALEASRQVWESELVAAHEEDSTRRADFYQQQLDTWQPGVDRAQVRSMLDRIRAEQPPRARFRCDLLALELVSATSVAVEELWRSPDGSSVEVPGTFDARTGELTLRDTAGSTIRSLAFCDARHAADATEVARCSGCSERACSQCAPAARVTQQCAICEGAFCSRCQDPSFRCALCERAACSRCSDAGLCQTCLLLDDAEEGELAALPAELALPGLRVLVGGDSRITVVAASGAQRRELIVVDSASSAITRWVSLAPTDPERLEAAALFTSAHGLPGDFVLTEDHQPAATIAVPSDGLPLRLHRWTEEVMTAPGLGITGPLPQSDTPSRVTPPLEHQRETLLGLAPPCNGAGFPLLRRRVERAGALWLDADGLHAWQAAGPSTTTDAFPWEGTLGEGPSLADLQPEDPPAMSCRFPSWLAARLERDGSHLVLRLALEENLQRTTDRDALARGLDALSDLVPLPHATRWLLVGREPLQGPDSPSLVLQERELSHPNPDGVRLLVGALPTVVERPVGRISAGPAQGPAGPGAGLLDAWVPTTGTTGSPATITGVEIRWPIPVPVADLWQDAAGRGISVSGGWVPGEGTITLHSAHGAIASLDACSRLHPSDASATHRCDSCERRACPECRPAEQVDRACGVCAGSVCRECLPTRAACPLCGRSACASCLSGHRLCPACRGENAEPVADPAVPSWLRASGLSVTRSADRHIEVLRLVGGSRREVVMTRLDSGTSEWLTLTPGDPALLADAVCAAAALGLSGDIRPGTRSVAALTPPRDPGAMELSHSNTVLSRWRSGGSAVAVGTFPRADGPSPRRPQGSLLRALTESTQASTGEGTECVLETIERTDRVSLTAEGIVREVTTGDASQRHVARWTPVDPGVPAGPPMHAEVQARAVASLPDGPAATLCSLGESFRFLMLRNGEVVTVWDLDDAQEHEEALAFGRAATGHWVPRTRLDPVPTHIPWELVQGLPTNCQPESHAWLARPAASGQPGQPLRTVSGLPARGDTPFALDLPQALPGRTIPEPVRLAIDEQAPRVDPGPAVPMEVLLRQGFTVPTGSGPASASVTVMMLGSEHRFVDEGGKPIWHPVVCASGHVGEAQREQQCQFCGQIRCARCEIPCAGCSICGIPICGSCTRGGHLCEACDDLTRIGVFAKRKWVKQHPDFVAGFTGYDRVHEVSVMLLGNGVRREVLVRGHPVTSSVPATHTPQLEQLFRRWL